ncbi:DegV family protein [Dysosmobacter sp.]|jgi:DegV family protein with EDD domain|uniref:DegV family protein n=1 Tax=Dysosmobacter sp. TaxID=2591382 RepID=UPI001BB48474|nr:DegV family protein [Dysosmobacter sp.]MCI6055598.1 DegV family EDD domain-containing protein [Dysosmobacter sp.]MDY5511020.1 DegV family protein [Dysosmobacter sp.]QUO36976.1 DegV family protein [Dysosmobacter sp. Marseille-Q4140]
MIWNIVSDSSCDLRTSAFHSDRVLFHSVPLRIQVGDQEFVDNDDLSVPEMLRAMAAEKSASSSACPSPADFAKAFEAGDCTVCFTISSNLSGTYNSAIMARDMVLEEYPEKRVCVIDSRATAGAMVLLIRRAKELMEADETGDFDGICAQLRLYQAALRTCFTLENFDNLIKNGRMRPLVGTLLHSLGIHVIADATPQGTIHVADKARGEAKTFRSITALMRASKECDGAEVVISHCENLEGAMKLKQQILEDLPVKQVEIISCRGLTSFYAMEKGLIVGY